jgi:hypothetical protein
MATATADKTFLPLQYTEHHYGQPIEAQSEVIRHNWCDHDDTDVRVEFTIEAGRDAMVNDYDVFHVWARESVHYTWPDKYETVSWFQSPRFTRFVDAEAYCQFAYQRWQATGILTASAMERRDDLDDKRNPIY